MFSSKTLADLQDSKLHTSFEEGQDIVESTDTEGNAEKRKKKKKKKQQQVELSHGASEGPQSEVTSFQAASERLGNLPKALSNTPREEQQETLRDPDLLNLKSTELEVISERSAQTSSAQAITTTTTMERTRQQPKGKAGTGKKKKKKKKKKTCLNQGILPSQVRFSVPEPTSKEGKRPKMDAQASGEREASEEDDGKLSSSSQEEEVNDLERFSNENFTKDDEESQNILQVLQLMYGVGLTTMRKLFMDIHPTWSNMPSDAMNLVLGKMKLKGHELALFNKGDINKWDVSLMTTVLLHSKKCLDEISKKPGFEDAIRSIKEHKNRLVSHACKDKMSDADYKVYWPALSKHLKTIGASTEEIEDLRLNGILGNGKVYRDLFLEEVASRSGDQSRLLQQLQNVNSKLDLVIDNQTNIETKSKNQLSPQCGGPNWDEWMKFCDNVHHFDYCQNNYILITDAMSPELLECFSILRSVPWKMVLDFDAASEEEGIYQDFVSKDGKSSLISMITPAEIRRQPITSLARHIDAKKTQWMFVNGRESDGSSSNGGPQELEDWEDVSVKEISKFFGCCSEPDKFDKHKPVICLVLPFRKESVPFINVTLRRLIENFNEYDLNFVGIKQSQFSSLPEKLLKKINIYMTDLDPELLRLGIEKLFDVSSGQSYCMPTSQANLPKKLTQTEYLYLKEYLDLLYEGCEDFMVDEDDKIRDDLIEEHRKSFMSGNWISFVSLFYNHDAKREIGNKVRTHIQRLLDQGPTHPTIVEISHSPGSGGSTIARRVMWDLHTSYPCVFAKTEDHKFDFEDDRTFLDLADRIGFLQDICNTTPVVLLDGKHTRIKALSNRLARVLNSKGKKAVLLRCNHSTVEISKNQNTSDSEVHATFAINVKLEQSKADLKEFEAKYKDYIEGFKEIKSLSGLTRVFHFPLLAMLEEFRTKLEQIVFESFEEMTNLEKEIVIAVAFIQKYAAQAIPAPLLYAAFKPSTNQSGSSHRYEQGITYEDISKIMTERLWNLMVPANPADFIHQGRFKRANYFQERYTLQHPVVAELVLKKAKMDLKRNTLAIARTFLSFPVYDDELFMPLLKDLFVLHGSYGQGRFSLLFEELKAVNPTEAGEVFCGAAEKTKDAVVATSAARFYAKVPPLSFEKAKELVAKAFECRNAKEKKKTIYDVQGVVLVKEMQFLSKHGKITSLLKLEELAAEALKSFRRARTLPPTFPNPLIGEVKTWLACIDWITKNQCDGDSNIALQFITSDDAPLFCRTCVSDSFHLLDMVDNIVLTVRSLTDPEKTQREANSVRLSLMQTLKRDKGSAKEGKSETDVIKACRALRCEKKFAASSELEIKRLQIQYVFSSVKPIESLNRRELDFLLELLTELVEVEKEEIFAKHLMKICVLVEGYSLDQGLVVCEIWSKKSQYDALPYFYEMMIYFLKILDGEMLENRAKYHAAWEKCREMSENNCRNTMSTHYLGKTETGMSCFMTRNTLFRGETEYKSLSNNEAAESYWKTKSRKKLRECSGRIRARTSPKGKKDYLTIELLQSNVQLYVKNAGIGGAYRDFVPDSKVYFVVSFNLLGPVANGITFKPSLQDQAAKM